jgi:predicted nucleotidyltransferase component of viral defense system
VILRANITAWRAQAPWALDEQVEQDLVLSRALCEIFARPELHEMLAFRGGKALHKLFFDPPGRYSEDLDLVQVTAGRDESGYDIDEAYSLVPERLIARIPGEAWKGLP